jgi:hypothetical protein
MTNMIGAVGFPAGVAIPVGPFLVSWQVMAGEAFAEELA